MEAWDLDYIDLVVPGSSSSRLKATGSWDPSNSGPSLVGSTAPRQVDGSTFIEWSWEGHSDADPGCGRGWATLVNGELVGRLFIHGGDDSAFKAIKRSRPFEPS